MSWFSDLLGFGGDGSGEGDAPDTIRRTTPIPVKLPDYPETDLARQNWSSKLQEWGTQPGYGAIQPNWNDIWNNARQKVQRYYGGGPEGPGLDSRVKSNLAARGMSENPAAETMIQRSGFQQGNQLQDIAVQMAMQEALLGEQGRQTWLGSVTNLANLRPQYAIGSETTVTNPKKSTAGGIGDILTTVLSGGLSGGGNDSEWLNQILSMTDGTGNMGGAGGSNQDFLSGIMNMFGGGSDSGSSDIGSLMSIFGGDGSSQGGMFQDENSWWGDILKLAAAAGGTAMGGPMGGQAGYAGADMLV